MKKFLDMRFGENETDFWDLYLPDGECNTLIIWFHGGGLEAGSRKKIKFAEELTSAGVGVASMEYRMYPTAKFPEFIEDGAAGVKYVLDHIGEYANPKRIYVSGSSAGAYITLMLAFDTHYFDDVGVDRNQITGYISDSAQITTHFNVLRERGLDKRLERIDNAAAIYHLSPDSDFGQLLLIYYSNDIPCRPEQNQLFYQSIRKLCPQQRVELLELPGGHCNGCTKRNVNGGFDFVDAVLTFIQE